MEHLLVAEEYIPHHREEINHLKLMIAALFNFQQDFEIQKKIKELKQFSNDANGQSEYNQAISEFYQNVKEWLTQLVIYFFGNVYMMLF